MSASKVRTVDYAAEGYNISLFGPKIVFRLVANHPLVLEYGMEYDWGSFTPTGITNHHIDPIEAWCKDQDCGTFLKNENLGLMYHIRFENTEKLAFFLLRWG